MIVTVVFPEILGFFLYQDHTNFASAANLVHIQCKDYLCDKLNWSDQEHCPGAKYDESLIAC